MLRKHPIYSVNLTLLLHILKASITKLCKITFSAVIIAAIRKNPEVNHWFKYSLFGSVKRAVNCNLKRVVLTLNSSDKRGITPLSVAG